MKSSDAQRAYDILKTYSGENGNILYMKIKVDRHDLILNEFQINYILQNHDFEGFEVNKILPISDIYGNKLKEQYQIDFVPTKIFIGKVIGEMGNSYHCYVQYRKSIKSQLMYVPKKYILRPLQSVDSNSLKIDFDKYDKMTEESGRKIKEHQKSAVKFLLSHHRCILADSMGLGKTLSATIAALEGGFKKILIITTASLKTTWKREISWYAPKEEITIVNGHTWKKHTKFTIMNYDILKSFYELPLEEVYEEKIVTNLETGEKEKKLFPVITKSKSNGKYEVKKKISRKKSLIKDALTKSQLFQEGFDCVIIDEVHKLSNKGSIRYNVVKHFLSTTNIQDVYLLTGTPLTNRPLNLYNILRLIEAEITDDYKFYTERYCGAREIHLRDGRTIRLNDKATNLDELCERLKHLYIRRLISDVPEMVNKCISTRYFDLNEEQTTKYNSLWSEYVESQLEKGENDNEEYRQLVEGTLVRRYLAMEMIPNTVQTVKDYLEDGSKVVVVCTFQEELDELMNQFGDIAVCFDGRMSIKQKDKAVDSFMNDKDITVFVGNIKAMSVGITLTSANIMIFNSYSWMETDNRQVQDRIWRITQTQDVQCIYQLFTDSVSQDMFEKVLYKGLIMDTVIKKESDK